MTWARGWPWDRGPEPTSFTVNLFGLELSATDRLKDAAGLGPGEAGAMAPYDQTGTFIGGMLAIDFISPDDDGRMYWYDIGAMPFSELFEASLTAGVSIDLLLEATNRRERESAEYSGGL